MIHRLIAWLKSPFFLLRHEERNQRDAENGFRKDIRGQVSFSLQSEFFPDVRAAEDSLDLDSTEAFPTVGAEPVASSTAPVQSTSPAVAESRSFAQVSHVFHPFYLHLSLIWGNILSLCNTFVGNTMHFSLHLHLLFICWNAFVGKISHAISPLNYVGWCFDH